MNGKHAATLLKMGIAALLLGALSALPACTPGPEDLAYPDLARSPVTTVPVGLMTPEEKDAAIASLNAEAGVGGKAVR